MRETQGTERGSKQMELSAQKIIRGRGPDLRTEGRGPQQHSGTFYVSVCVRIYVECYCKNELILYILFHSLLF